MSLLIEKNMRTSGPRLVPGDVKNVDIKSGVGKVSIKWTDPDDTTYENYTFIKWKGTILIRKKDSAPSNVNDGVVLINSTNKNQYKDTAYEDNNLEDGNYYYRFFVYSEDKVYNDSSNMIYNTNVVSADPILKNNSWETIIDIANKGQGQNYWKIGDTIDIKLSGTASYSIYGDKYTDTYDETITLQIWDFNHFDKSDGTGKANICFGMKNLLKTSRKIKYSTTDFSWPLCEFKRFVLPATLGVFPELIKNSIKEVNTYANRGQGTAESIGELSSDKLFIPGATETGYTYSSQNRTEKGQIKFPIFTDNYSRMKYSDTTKSTWWTRSPSCETMWYYYCYIDRDGLYDDYYAREYRGICLCFNI